MLVKFLARGTGSARDAADYLLGERDAAGKPREGVEVLRGDPHRVAAVGDTLPFEHRYTSGVIAWAPEDEPTDQQIGAVLDAFEETAWAGLEFDRYAWAAVLHRERGGGAAAGGPPARILTPRPDPGLPAPTRRERHGAEPVRCRRRPAGGGPRSAAPRQGLSDRPRSGQRTAVAAERRAVRP